MKASATVKPEGWGRRTLILALLFTLATALGACGGESVRLPDPTEEIVSAQITNLSSQDYTVRRCAARALGRIGPRAKKAVPSLLHALEDAEPTVRDAASLALNRIEPGSKERTIARFDRDAHLESSDEKGALQP